MSYVSASTQLVALSVVLVSMVTSTTEPQGACLPTLVQLASTIARRQSTVSITNWENFTVR